MHIPIVDRIQCIIDERQDKISLLKNRVDDVLDKQHAKDCTFKPKINPYKCNTERTDRPNRDVQDL